MYPWPMGDFDYSMDVAFDTAMNYLERPGQAETFVAVLSNTCPAKGACWSARRRLGASNDWQYFSWEIWNRQLATRSIPGKS